MKLIIIIGNTAVGKMTIGQALAQITDLRLFHNHMSIELVLDVFGVLDSSVVAEIREVIFSNFAKSNNYGLIFTYQWAFDSQSDWDYIEKVSKIFTDRQAEVYYVEVIAPQDIRLERNKTDNRLFHKKSKQDLEFSRQLLVEDDLKYRCVSYEGEIQFENYLRIDNSNMNAVDVAELIKETFNL